jgi:hypothetical protein
VVNHSIGFSENLEIAAEESTFRTLFLASSLRGKGTIKDIYLQQFDEIPLNWEDSMEAFAFAETVMDGGISPAKEEQLVSRWNQLQYLHDGMHWCPVGSDLSSGRRMIAMTDSSLLFRFFESGRFHRGKRRIFLRHGTASLVDCISSAIDTCGKDSHWSIIT